MGFAINLPTNTAPAPLFGFGIVPNLIQSLVSGFKYSCEAKDFLLYPPIQNITVFPAGMRFSTDTQPSWTS